MVKTIGFFALTFQQIEDLVFRLAILPDVLTGANTSKHRSLKNPLHRRFSWPSHVSDAIPHIAIFRCEY
jgi:hypothetical protein